MTEPMSGMRKAARQVHAHEDAMLRMEFELLHRRDDDLSVKSGAILGFAGLLIASTLVLLAAEPETALHASADEVTSLAAAAGLVVLFFGAAAALTAISMTRVYVGEDAPALLERLERRLKSREMVWRWSCALTFLGAVTAGAAYVLVIAGNALGLHV